MAVHHDALVPTLGCAGLLLLFAAQRDLQPPRVSAGTALALLVGLGLWVLVAALASQRQAPRQALVESRGRVRRLPLMLALVAALVAWFDSGDGVYQPTNVATWLLAVAAWCVAWWPGARKKEASTERRRLPPAARRNLWWLVVLAVIVVVGGFFRFHQIGDVPSEPVGDHVEKLLDLQDVREGARPLFFPRNGGREPGQFYFTYGVLIEGLGLDLSFETLKLGTAFIGLLAIPAIFLLGQEVAGRAAGLFAAALFAISAWPVATARVGLRYPFGPLATALTLWLLLRYIRRGDRRDALACGVVIGLGLHGYTSFRVVPLLVPLLLVVALIFTRRVARASPWGPLQGTALIYATAFVSGVPLARYALDHPDLVSARMRKTLLKDDYREATVSWSNAVPTFLDNTWNALFAFNWSGDPAGMGYAVLFEPLLDGVTGAALLAGLVIAVWRAVRMSFADAALLISAPILFLPSTLQLAVPDWNPSASRLGSLAPVVFVIAALPFALLWKSVQQVSAGSWWHALRSRSAAVAAVTALIVTAFAIAAHQNYGRYFGDYARQYREQAPNSGEIAAAMQTRLDQGVELNDMYILGYPHWVDIRLVGFALGQPDWAAGHGPGLDDPLPRPRHRRPLLFVLHPKDALRARQLAARFPGGSQSLAHGSVHEFLLFDVPPA